MWSVYVCFTADGKAVFVGYTRDLERRSIEHRGRGWVTTEAGRVESLRLARVFEQRALDELGGLTAGY